MADGSTRTVWPAKTKSPGLVGVSDGAWQIEMVGEAALLLLELLDHGVQVVTPRISPRFMNSSPVRRAAAT